MSQFRTFREGLQLLNDKVDRGFNKLNQRIDKLDENNRQEHKQIIQAVQDLDSEVKRFDTEVVKIKRVKYHTHQYHFRYFPPKFDKFII